MEVERSSKNVASISVYKHRHRRLKMKNWKTTLGGLVIAVPQIAMALGLAIPEPISKLLLAVGAAWLAYFAKDKNVTGTS